MRHQKIIEAVESSNFVSFTDLRDILEGVSDSTIKRDLRAMAAKGQVKLVRGGAVKCNAGNTASFDVPIDTKFMTYAEEKKRIL